MPEHRPASATAGESVTPGARPRPRDKSINSRSGIPAALALGLALAALVTAQPVRAASASAVSAGGRHTCALTLAGGVQCWGANEVGQLGNGATAGSRVPVDVSGLVSGVSAVTAADYHTCALTSGGGVKCWGYNEGGQLGNGSDVDSSTPVDVAGLGSDVVAVAAGGSHTCAVTTAGAVKCWGWNLYGQLGDGTPTARATPVGVSGLDAGVTAVAAGTWHACALTAEGGVKCWGANEFGQLGDGVSGSPTGAFLDGSLQNMAGVAQIGPGDSSPTPVDVTDLSSGVRAITAGAFHSCALTTTGVVKCWGHNEYGQLGGVADDPVGSPGGAFVDGLAQNMAAGSGGGAAASSATPVTVAGLGAGVRAVAAGAFHNCAVTSAGGVKCWGRNDQGQLGTAPGAPEPDGSPAGAFVDGTPRGLDAPPNPRGTTPVAVPGLAVGVSAVSAGNAHSCAVSTTGAVKCWGGNAYGQLGNGTNAATPTPATVTGLAGSVCGDGLVQGAERCDDGDQTAGDGCGSTCAIESGFTCVSGAQPSDCALPLTIERAGLWYAASSGTATITGSVLASSQDQLSGGLTVTIREHGGRETTTTFSGAECDTHRSHQSFSCKHVRGGNRARLTRDRRSGSYKFKISLAHIDLGAQVTGPIELKLDTGTSVYRGAAAACRSLRVLPPALSRLMCRG